MRQTPKYETGFPGSVRWPKYLEQAALTVPCTGSNPLVVPLDQQVYENDDPKLPLFITRLVLSAAGGSAVGSPSLPLFRLQLLVRPTNSPQAWMSAPASVPVFMENDRNNGQATAPLVWELPEPYPLAPGSKLEISAFGDPRGANPGDFTSVCIGAHAYYESMPAYTTPRKTPFVLVGELENGSLASGSVDTFSQSDLAPATKFVAERIGVRAVASAGAENLTDLTNLLFRFGISGRKRSMDGRVPLFSLIDPATGQIPLYDTELSPGENFTAELENQTGDTIQTATCCVVGYKQER